MNGQRPEFPSPYSEKGKTALNIPFNCAEGTNSPCFPVTEKGSVFL